jgi:hypothetical protein
MGRTIGECLGLIHGGEGSRDPPGQELRVAEIVPSTQLALPVAHTDGDLDAPFEVGTRHIE